MFSATLIKSEKRLTLLAFLLLLLLAGIVGFRHLKTKAPDELKQVFSSGYAQLQRSGLDQAVVAKVGDVEISGEEFFISYEIGPSFVKRNHRGDPKTAHLKYMIYEKLLALDGLAANVASRPDVQQILQEIEQDLAVTEMFREMVSDSVQIRESEVEQAVSEATLNINFKFVYAKHRNDLQVYQNRLASGTSFDAFALQGGSFSKEINFWEIKQKDAIFAEELTKLKFHQLSEVIETPRGFYLAQVDTAWRETFITPVKHNELSAKLKKRLKRAKVEALAYEYAAQRLENASPVIKSSAFKRLLTYFETLQPTDADEATAVLGNWPGTLDWQSLENREKATLVMTNFGDFDIKSFLDWYTLRRFPLNRQTKEDLAVSLKNIVWRMVRDRMLAREAFERDYDQHPQVIEEMGWWQEKLAYWQSRETLLGDLKFSEAQVRQFYKNNRQRYATSHPDSLPSFEEIGSEVARELYVFEEGKRLQTYLNQKEQEMSVRIYHEVLDKIPVTDLNFSKPIDMALFKKQGTFPRIAYPTIDRVWERY